MKTIINKEVQIKDPDDNLMLRSDLLKIVTNTPPEKGLTITAMRERMKILDILDDCKGANEFKTEFTLEDAQFTLLKKLFDEYGWRTPHKELIELADHLDELSKIK
jgi:hypothetical protein